jgi:hypothetical protein
MALVPAALICRLEPRPHWHHQPGGRDLIGAWAQGPVAVLSVRLAGVCRASHLAKGDGHHHHRTPRADPRHRRGRHPPGRARRPRQGCAGQAPGNHEHPNDPGRLPKAARLGPGLGRGPGLGYRGHRLLWRCADPIPARAWASRGRGQPARPVRPPSSGKVRPARRRGCRPGGAGQRRHWPAQVQGRQGGDAALPAGCSQHCGQGPHPGDQRPQGASSPSWR